MTDPVLLESRRVVGEVKCEALFSFLGLLSLDTIEVCRWCGDIRRN